MRDDERGLVTQQSREGVLHERLGLDIQTRSRLVEDQERRVLEECAREREALCLARAQARAAFAKRCRVPARQGADKFVGVGEARRARHVVK